MRVRSVAFAAAFAVVVSSCSAASSRGSGPPGTSPPAASSTTQVTLLSSDDRRWVSPIEPVSSPTGSADEIFVTTQDRGNRLQGVALDAATGEVLWRHQQTLAGRLGGMGIQSPIPVRSGDRWLAVQLEPDGGGAAYVARDARTGAVRWTYPVERSLEVNACGSLICIDSEGRDGYRWVALDPSTGDEAWSYETSSTPTSMDLSGPTLVIVEIGSPPLLHGLDASTGTEIWTADAETHLGDGATTDGGWNSVRSGDGLVVDIGSYRGTPEGLVVVDVATGAVRWVAKEQHLSVHMYADINQAPQALAAAASQPLLTERLTVDEDRASIDDLSRLDPATGQPLWTRPLGFVFDEESSDIGVIRASDGTAAWLTNPQTDELVGVDLESGAEIDPTGQGWTSVRSTFEGGVEVDGQEHPFAPPTMLDGIELPSRKTIAPTAPPPPVLVVSAGKLTAWVDADGHLRAQRQT